MNDKEQISGSSNIYDLMVKNLMSPKVEGGSGLSAEEATKIAVRALQKLKGESADIELAFDVGHSSLGWAVLQTTPNSQASTLNLLGCGVVTFGADDCLASKRRLFRRQRRHARATRQRIERLEKLLAHLGVMGAEQLKSKHTQAGGHSAPWLLAARVLASNGDAKHLLTWPELWDVLRWYAHNRGYDGNKRWSAAKEDSEKEQNARSLMEKFATTTMAETFCQHLNLDPLGAKQASAIRFKGLNAAFPREGVEAEVRRVLQAHFGKLPKVDSQFEQALFDNWQAIPCPDIKLPKRFQGGLLFGQLVPRFDNRIIAQCPITFAEEYQRLIGEGLASEEAKHEAGVLAKVPGRNCPEFFNFRWAMTLANIRIGHGAEIYRDRDGKEAKLRPLHAEERRKVDAAVRRKGFLRLEKDKADAAGHVRAGKNELLEIVVAESKCDRHNLEGLLLDPNAKDGLELLPLEGDLTAFRLGWACFDDPAHDADGFYRDSALRHRFTVQLLRQKKLSLTKLVDQLEKIGQDVVASRIREAARKGVSDRRGNVNEEKLAKLMVAEFFCPKLKGRARFSRVKLRQAFQEVFRNEKPLHPLETGGCLEQTEAIKQAAIEQDLAEQTNNHLVRHRLLILAGEERAKPKPKEGLLQHLILEFAGGDKRRVARITVELARDLQTMSGMSNKAKAKELFAKLANHTEVSEDLAKKLRDDATGNPLRDANGRPFAASPGLIRKARILHDLDMKCPYTGEVFQFVNLVHSHSKGTVDKDHVIPRSQRLSDALEAQVITFSEINRLKGQRTALQFVREMNLPEKKHDKERFGIRTEAQFRAFVDSLWPSKDPFIRARAGGEKVRDDEARCWRRKKLLLTPTWDAQEFTPADLTKTRHIVKLAAQRLEGGFSDLPKEERPPVIAITGAVTASFRDKSWKLLGELAAVNPAVKDTLAKGAQEWDAGRDFNPKKAIRAVTHLHHALDSIALGLVTSMLVPPKHQSLDGDLARFIVKGKLTVDKERGIDEVSAFRALCAKLRLPPFVQMDSKNRLHIKELDETLKVQIRARLAEKRVVQHIPADMSGMKAEENTRGVVKVEKDRVYLRQRTRDAKTGKLSVKETDEVIGKVVGLDPRGGPGKLTPMKGVRVISDNFGVAILDHATSPEDKFVIIPWHKVWHRIEELKEKNGGKRPRVLRNGMLARATVLKFEGQGRPKKGALPKEYPGTYRVSSIKLQATGDIELDLSTADGLDLVFSNRAISREIKGLEILKPSLCGVAQAAPVPAAEGR